MGAAGGSLPHFFVACGWYPNVAVLVPVDAAEATTERLVQHDHNGRALGLYKILQSTIKSFLALIILL